MKPGGVTRRLGELNGDARLVASNLHLTLAVREDTTTAAGLVVDADRPEGAPWDKRDHSQAPSREAMMQTQEQRYRESDAHGVGLVSVADRVGEPDADLPTTLGWGYAGERSVIRRAMRWLAWPARDRT